MATTYRLIEIPLRSVADTEGMHRWKHKDDRYVHALRRAVPFPPVVVYRTPRGWSLLDGVNRTYAAWTLGRPKIQAYELLQGLV